MKRYVSTLITKRHNQMNRMNNKVAINFYNELLEKNIVEKNEEIKIRLSEVSNWQQAFTVVVKHAAHFRLNILQKKEMVQLAQHYGFKPDFINSLTA